MMDRNLLYSSVRPLFNGAREQPQVDGIGGIFRHPPSPQGFPLSLDIRIPRGFEG